MRRKGHGALLEKSPVRLLQLLDRVPIAQNNANIRNSLLLGTPALQARRGYLAIVQRTRFGTISISVAHLVLNALGQLLDLLRLLDDVHGENIGVGFIHMQLQIGSKR